MSTGGWRQLMRFSTSMMVARSPMEKVRWQPIRLMLSWLMPRMGIHSTYACHERGCGGGGGGSQQGASSARRTG